MFIINSSITQKLVFLKVAKEFIVNNIFSRIVLSVTSIIIVFKCQFKFTSSYIFIFRIFIQYNCLDNILEVAYYILHIIVRTIYFLQVLYKGPLLIAEIIFMFQHARQFSHT